MATRSARSTLAKNRREALAIADKVGATRLRAQLKKAEVDLTRRLKLLDPRMLGTFTEQRMNATLTQVRHVLAALKVGMSKAIIETALEAAEAAGGHVIEYLNTVEHAYRGAGSQPLALEEASMLDSARNGAQASVLRRLATSGTNVPGALAVPHMAKLGILDRYGMNVVASFEQELRIGLVTRKPWEEIKDALVASSPFLQGKPRFWAERIARTETMGAYNRAGYESVKDADEQLGDMVKILSATFDDRTASDSYAVHGQIRRPNEMFDTWEGQVMHPPARPNDREIVVPHRISWPLPPYLFPKDRGEVVARWLKEKRKGKPPETPLDSTVDRSLFGQEPAPRIPRDGKVVAPPKDR